MFEPRVKLVNSLITLTEAGKLTWEIGVRSDQFYATLPSGSVVLSKRHPVQTGIAAAHAYSGGAVSPSEYDSGSDAMLPSGGAASHTEVTQPRNGFDTIYQLDVRDKSASIIDSISSETWKWLPGASQERGIAKLYELAQKSVRDAKDRQLSAILNDLNTL